MAQIRVGKLEWQLAVFLFCFFFVVRIVEKFYFDMQSIRNCTKFT